MKIFVCLFAVIAYASASVVSSGWNNDWPTYGAGWSYGGGYSHTPVKVIKVVAPSHGWSSGWKPTYSSGWSSGSAWPSYSSAWPPSSAGWSSGWPSSSSSLLLFSKVGMHGQASGQAAEGQATPGQAVHGQAPTKVGGKSEFTASIFNHSFAVTNSTGIEQIP